MSFPTIECVGQLAEGYPNLTRGLMFELEVYTCIKIRNEKFSCYLSNSSRIASDKRISMISTKEKKNV